MIFAMRSLIAKLYCVVLGGRYCLPLVVIGISF